MRPLSISVVVAGAFGAAVFGAPAQAACVWGQPGYRACVDALLAERKAQDARTPGAADQVRRYPTAPAKDRAPQLTPLDQMVGVPAPVPRAPRGVDPTADNQRMMDDNFARTQRDDARPAIMPRSRDLFPMPGRICPSQGC